jgi:hypothetical protein
MTAVTEKHADTGTTAVESGPVPRSPKLSRRPFLVVLAAVLVVAGAMAGGLLWASATKAGEVVVVRQDVARGTVVTAQDLGTVRVGVDPSLSTVPASELASLVGKRASADLTAGTLLAAAQVSETVVPGPGESVVGVPISPGLMPVEPLASGDAVRLVRSGELPSDSTPTDPVTAKVLRVTPGDTQTVVDVIVTADKAVQVAEWAGSGKIALVLDSRAR